AVSNRFQNVGTYTGTGIWKSTDSGVHWTHQVLPGLSGSSVKRITVALSKSTLTYLYAWATDWYGYEYSFLKTTKSSLTWNQMWTNSLGSHNPCSGDGAFSPPLTGQCDYDMFLAVDPTNKNIVYAGGVDVVRSLDGGSSWGNITRSYDYYV